jgi:hypothetical protein
MFPPRSPSLRPAEKQTLTQLGIGRDRLTANGRARKRRVEIVVS